MAGLTSREREEIRVAIQNMGETAKQQLSNAHPGWDATLEDRVLAHVLKKHGADKVHAKYCELTDRIEAMEKEQAVLRQTLEQKLPSMRDGYGHDGWQTRLRRLCASHKPEFLLSDPVGKQIRAIEIEVDRRVRGLLAIESRSDATPLLAEIKVKSK